MPTESQFNEVWLWASTATFLIKGAIFLILAQSIRHEHAKVGSTPTPLGKWLIRFFFALFCASFALSLVFGLALWSSLEGTGQPPPPPKAITFEVRTIARIAVLFFPWCVNAAGMKTVSLLREEARSRATGGSDAHRQMRATERLADQGDELAKAGVVDRSATATERPPR